MQLKFILIPDKLLEDTTLRASDRILYGVIYSLCQAEKGKCTASNSMLGKLARVAPQTVQAALLRLERANTIRRISITKPDGKIDRLEIVPLIDWSMSEGGHLQMKVGDTFKQRGGTPSNELENNTLRHKESTEPQKAPEHEEFRWEEYRKMMLADTKRPANPVIVSYWFLKGTSFNTKAQVSMHYGRAAKTALALLKAGYSLDEIKGCMKYCAGRFEDMWTLETVAKYMPEYLKAKARTSNA